MARTQISSVNWVLTWALTMLPSFFCSAADNTTRSTVPLVYQPPATGAPKARVGAGTRGGDKLLALAPAHVGLTLNSQPRLYWYTAPGIEGKLRFRLTDIEDAFLILEAVQNPLPGGGIGYLDLAEHGVHLEPGRVYRWLVMLEPVPRHGFSRVTSGGSIRMPVQDYPVQGVSDEERLFDAALQGFWYEALDRVSRLAEREPADPHWYQQRASLLKQGGLDDAAEFERRRVEGSR